MKILVCGAGGFIGTHLVSKLKQQGHYVIGADLKYPEYTKTDADEFHIIDLRDYSLVEKLITSDIDQIYQLAADMGGAGFIFTGENDADIMHNSATINLNVLDVMRKKGVKNVLYTSSACIYPEYNQLDPRNPKCYEASAYPANPDSEYGWEKLFSERLYLSYAKNYNFNVRIARLHNVFGPLGSWNNGREKAPAALCRKVLQSDGIVEVWGPGNQTRSFMYIDECIEGILRLTNSDINIPINIGSARMISINELVHLISNIANKHVEIKNIPGPRGVMGRTSDNTLIKQLLNWEPADNLELGLEKTLKWISNQQVATQLTVPPSCQVENIKEIYANFLPSLAEGCFVEIGAYDGESYSNTSFLADFGWKGLYIEPIKHNFLACVDRHKKNTNVKVANLAVGDENKKVKINVWGALSTIDELTHEAHQKLFNIQDECIKEEILQVTLNDLLHQYHILPNFDLLVVDVEGQEWGVFKRFDFAYWNPTMIIVELVDLHPGYNDFIQIKENSKKVREHILSHDYTQIYCDAINSIFVKKIISP